jgi:hypothetical protein
MAKPSTKAEVNNFVGGLITEASPLNFPANASLDEQNFELNRDGTRDRRLGMGFEPDSSFQDTGVTAIEAVSAKFATFKWDNVKGIAIDEFLVVQASNNLLFYRLDADSISGSGYLGSLKIASFPTDVRFSFTSTEGVLVVVAGISQIALVSYDDPGFSVTYEKLKVRDVWGAEVKGIPAYETDDAYRGAADNIHYYNLVNQSWGIPRSDSTGALSDPITLYNTALGVYPSNNEVVWTGLQFQPVTAGVTFERVYPNLYTDTLGANVKAAKGYFIIDLLDRGASRMAEFTANEAKYPVMTISSVVLPADTTSGGASVATEYAGRIWYAGFSGEVSNGDARSPNLSNFVLFSQLVRNKRDFVKCYQVGDPTSRENGDLVDTDGGFVRVSGAKTILSLIDLESHLIVIADNGVWTITGGSDYGFTATNYKVTKISSFGGISDSSVVIEGGRAFFWSKDGIYVIAKDQFGSFTVVNITQSTIQTLYENIPLESKETAVGEYDPISKKIRWIFNTGVRFSASSITKELILDTVLNVFYQNVIVGSPNNSVETVSLFASKPYNRGEVFNTVYVDLDVVYAGSESVGVNETIRTSGIQSIRYLTISNTGLVASATFSYYNNIDFLDWQEVDGVGVDAKGYLLTGQQTVGDSSVAKQIPYLIMHMKRTESGVTSEYVPDRQSSCFMRCQWDFANTINSKKWTELVQVYRYRRPLFITGLDDEYDNGFETVISKSKVRGRGKAFSFYLETEPRKDCRIIGWSISLNGNQVA